MQVVSDKNTVHMLSLSSAMYLIIDARFGGPHCPGTKLDACVLLQLTTILPTHTTFRCALIAPRTRFTWYTVHYYHYSTTVDLDDVGRRGKN
jgi:hypothetical protein